MERTNFDHLLDQYLTRQLPQKEKIKLEAWLDVVKTKYKADLILTPEDEERLFAVITSKIDTVDDIIIFRPQTTKRERVTPRPWFSMAATISLLLAASFGFWYFANVRNLLTQNVATTEFGKRILTDGSIVWLQEGSKLSYQEEGNGDRLATLEGEALFEVAKDPDHPFMIRCGDILVKVLGTSFSLKTGKSDVTVKVLTGKVNLSSAKDDAGVTLIAKEKITYTPGGKVETSKMDDRELATIVAGTEYNMAFKDAAMAVVIERIEKKFDITIKTENKRLYQCHLSVDFTDHSLDTTLRLLSEIIDITYTVRGNEVTISGSGCN